MKKKVLIVDDSALIREILSNLINSLPDFEVAGIASDPHFAAKMLVDVDPDIITLDVEMPRMDGLTFLEKIMRLRPRPVLIISSLAAARSEVALKAMELGAVDCFEKPARNVVQNFEFYKETIAEKLRACEHAKVQHYVASSSPMPSIAKTSALKFKTTDKVIAIGASTGGTVALMNLLTKLPANLPGILIVQHMPAGFTTSFANRLDECCELIVKEAKDGDAIIPGQVLLSPGDKHMAMRRSGARFFVELLDTEPVNKHKPSVDVLFESVAEYAGQNAIGVMLTGMGRDGSKSMLLMKEQGAYNLAESEESCTVFGMPKAAIEVGAVNEVGDIDFIAKKLLQYKV